MAIGTIDFDQSQTSGKYIDGKIEWSSSTNKAANSSDVTVKLYVKKGDTTTNLTIPTEGTWSYKLTVNGSAVSGTAKKSVLKDWVLVYTRTVSGISHDGDGTKSITISGSVTAPSASSFKGHTSSGSGTAEFDEIPRASSIDSAANVTLGNACSIKWIPKSTSFRYKLKFALGNWNYTTAAIHPNSTAAYTYTGYVIPLDVANQFKTRASDMTVTLYTYSDSDASTQIGSDSETFTVTVPDNEATKPTVRMSLYPVSDLKAPFDSLYIQGKCKLKADLDFDTEYGADVIASNITLDVVVYESPYETGYLTKTGEYTVKGTVKDSREHYGTAEQKITVIPYSKPIVQATSGESNIVAARCDSNGNIKDSGTYLKIKAKMVYEKVIFDGVQHNFGKIQFRYRVENGLWSEWYTILNAESSTDTEVTTAALLNGTLSVKSNYQVQIKAVDNIEESQPVTLIISSDDVYMDRPAGGNGMGLGGYCSGPGNLDIYWKTKARGGLYLFNEAGEELNLGSILPLPRGPLGEGWNPNDIANGVHEVSTYPLKDAMGNMLMENGALIQLAVDTDGFVKLQMAFPTDTFTPVYRLKWYTNWSDWLSFKI